MYDTGLPLEKIYVNLMADWSLEILDWSKGTSVLFGVPVYDDTGVGYHTPKVENLANALSGIHSGLASYPRLPPDYQGVAIYSEWEVDSKEWSYWKKNFLK